MTIDSYDFGHIVIDGKTYSSDVIIYPDKVNADWWRKEGHLLQTEDLSEVLLRKPDMIIIGTGKYGVLKVSPACQRELKSLGIETVVKTTDGAVTEFNRRSPDKQVIAALHLTC